MDATKSVSLVCIPSMGLALIDAKTKGGDSGGAPDFRTTTELGRPGGPVLRGFGSVDLKPFSGCRTRDSARVPS
jgi:hypothetical protein